MAKIIDSTNLGYLISKIKATFWPKSDVVQIDIDNSPTLNSDNLVKSGGVYSAIADKYTKPSTGIPASDLATGVIPDVSNFITNSVNNLTNYYLKSETYTKSEVEGLIAAINQFHYEIAASTSAVSSPASNVLYLIGPTGSGADKYEEYVYASSTWTKIGDTSIDLSGYVTTQALNTALADYTTTANLTTLLANKQDVISDLTDIRSGAAAGATAYQKPNTGIPDSDLANDVQASLDKADSAYQLPSDGIPASDLKDTYAGSPTAGGPAFKTLGIPYGSIDSTSTSTVLKATVDNFPSTLTDGVCAYIRNDAVASANGWTLNINNTGALPVYASNADTTRTTTVFTAASTYLFVYNSTRVSGGCWDIYYGYNANDNTIGYNLRTNGITAVTSAKFYRYRMLFTSMDGTKLIPANTSTSTNATASRTVNQTPINPFGPIWYYSTTTAIEANAGVGASYLWLQYSAITLGYSFNRAGAALTLTSRRPIYLKCAPQIDGSAIMDADTPIVQVLPSTEDGKIYIFLGYAESATAVTLYYWHPIYYYKNGAIRQWTNASEPIVDSVPTANSDNLVKSGGVYSAINEKYTKPSNGIPASDIASGVIPSAPGTLNTNNATSQTASSSEALSGNINLHKIAKTGSFRDLLNVPTDIAYIGEEEDEASYVDSGTIIDVSTKADKVVNGTDGNFAAIGNNGNFVDSGHKHSDYQATLVSGTNIKTINNESILGSGNITIQGGSGGGVSSVAMTVPTGLSVTGSPITTSGTLAVSLASGYSIPTTTKQSQWDGKQDALVSGTNIKTINNQSLLGSGNITISGGSGEGGSVISWNQKTSTGVNIASITIDGSTTEIYAPSGGGNGDSVSWNQKSVSGINIAAITINGTTTQIYAPTGSSVSWGTAGSDYVPLTVNGTTKNVLTSHQSLTSITNVTNNIKVGGNNVSSSNPLKVVFGDANSTATSDPNTLYFLW